MMIVSIVGLVVAVISTALAVDLGLVAQEKRHAQKVADMSALDAVRGLNDSYVAGLSRLDLTVLLPKRVRAEILARESALRNGFDPADVANGHSLAVDLGTYDTSQPDNFLPACAPPVPALCPNDNSADAVKVTVGSKARFSFRGGERTLTVDAVGRQQSTVPTTTTPPPTPTTAPPVATTVPPSPTTASFSIGSSLVNLNTSSSALLNPIIGQMLGSSASISGVSWQGLAGGNVTLEALRRELADLGFNVGTVNQLMNADLTAAQLYRATASALTKGGDAANANALNIFRSVAQNQAKFSLGDLIKVQTGTPDEAVLSTSLNLLQLVTGSAEVINGTNTVSVPNVSIAVPGVASTTLSLKVTELPQVYVGPVGGSVSTGQVDLTTTAALTLNVTVGLTPLKVTGDFPVNLELAGATGTLKAANCGSSKSITVTADPKAFDGAARVTTLRVSTLLNIPVLDVQTTSATPSVNGPPVDLSFSYPSQFTPPADPPFSKHAGSQPVGLQSLTSVTPGTVTVLGALPLGTTTGDIVNAVMNALPPVVGNVDNNILTPLLSALGVDVGSTDVTALALNCPTAPAPAPTTTTTPPTTPAPTPTTTPMPVPNGAPILVG